MSEEISSLKKAVENRRNIEKESSAPDTTAFEATLSSEKVDELYETIIEETISDKNFSEIKAFAESVIISATDGFCIKLFTKDTVNKLCRGHIT